MNFSWVATPAAIVEAVAHHRCIDVVRGVCHGQGVGPGRAEVAVLEGRLAVADVGARNCSASPRLVQWRWPAAPMKRRFGPHSCSSPRVRPSVPGRARKRHSRRWVGQPRPAWKPAGRTQVVPPGGATGSWTTVVIDWLLPSPETWIVSCCGPGGLVPTLAGQPVSGRCRLRRERIAGLPRTSASTGRTGWWRCTEVPVAGRWEEGSSPAWCSRCTPRAMSAKTAPGSYCCWMSEVTSAAAVRSIVSKLAAVRSCPDPEIEVAKASRMAVAPMPITVRVIRISTRVSPASERRRSPGTGAPPVAPSWSNRRRLMGAAPRGTVLEVPLRPESP